MVIFLLIYLSQIDHYIPTLSREILSIFRQRGHFSRVCFAYPCLQLGWLAVGSIVVIHVKAWSPTWNALHNRLVRKVEWNSCELLIDYLRKYFSIQSERLFLVIIALFRAMIEELRHIWNIIFHGLIDTKAVLSLVLLIRFETSLKPIVDHF